MNDADKGVNTLLVKDINTKVVLGKLRELKASAIRELASGTGLSVVTVKGILEDLVALGRVLPGDLAPSGGGRPSRQYIYNEKARLGLIVFTRETDGRDSIWMTVIDLLGNPVETLDPLFDISWPDLEKSMENCIAEYPDIAAVAFGIPGREFEGRIVMDYKALSNLPLAKMIGKKFRLPVLIENDVNAAVMGHNQDAGQGRTEVYLYFPEKYPPGAGIRIDGGLLRGNRNFAGEIAWLPLGITWGTGLSRSLNDFSAAAAKVILSLCAVLDPDEIILFGEFLTEKHRKTIGKIISAKLPEGSGPVLSLAADFNSDFERGLTAGLLEKMES